MTRGQRELVKTIGRNVAARRDQLGLTQDELGGMLGFSGDWVSKLERGRSCLDLRYGEQFKEALQIESIDELMQPDAFAPPPVVSHLYPRSARARDVAREISL